MGIANMPEDYVLARKLPLERLAIDRDHLPVTFERNREVRIHLQDAPAANKIVDSFRQRMTETAKALAIEITGGKPGCLGQGFCGGQALVPRIVLRIGFDL